MGLSRCSIVPGPDLQWWEWDNGVDGVELRRLSAHSCQLWGLRCKYAGRSMLAKGHKFKVVMAIRAKAAAGALVAGVLHPDVQLVWRRTV